MMKRVVLIALGIVILGGAALVLTNGSGSPRAEPSPALDGAGGPELPPGETPPGSLPLLTLTRAELGWDLGGAECVATGETLVPTLTVCVRNDGDGEAEAALLAGVVSDVESLGGTPYEEGFASGPLAPGDERCLSATVDPSLVADAGVLALASVPDAEPIPLVLPELPPLCGP